MNKESEKQIKHYLLTKTKEQIIELYLQKCFDEKMAIDNSKIIKRQNIYTEIFKLKLMLDKHHIPYEFYNRNNPYYEQYQITYLHFNNRVCSVIEGDFTVGGDADLLEIQGLLTPDEKEFDSIKGYLSAKEVFDRIYKDYAKNV